MNPKIVLINTLNIWLSLNFRDKAKRCRTSIHYAYFILAALHITTYYNRKLLQHCCKVNINYNTEKRQSNPGLVMKI